MLDAEQRRYLCYLVHLERMRLLPVDELGAAYQTFAATGKNPLPHRLNELGFNNLQQYHLNQLIDQTWLAIAESPQLISDFFLRETGEQAFLCSIDDPPVRAWCAELFSLKKTAFDQRNGEAPTLANGEPPHSSQHSNGHTNAVHSADAIPPAKIKTRFELVEPPLAGGGQGAIYRAYDNYLSRYVAVKKLKEQSSAGAPGQPSEASKRLVAEARITARLQHPNIIQIYDLSEQDTGPSFAMQLLQDTEGNKTETYQDLIKKHHALNAAGQAGLRNASLRRLLEQLVVVCRSIHYAHTQGVFHRDLKPLNILCGQHGDIQVIDWGLAKLTHERVWSSLYETERMSPESMGLPQTKLGQLSGSPRLHEPRAIRREFQRPDQEHGHLFLGRDSLLHPRGTNSLRRREPGDHRPESEECRFLSADGNSTGDPAWVGSDLFARDAEKTRAALSDGRRVGRRLAALVGWGTSLGVRRKSLADPQAMVCQTAGVSGAVSHHGLRESGALCDDVHHDARLVVSHALWLDRKNGSLPGPGSCEHRDYRLWDDGRLVCAILRFARLHFRRDPLSLSSGPFHDDARHGTAKI